MREKYLPLGSIVKIKDSKRKLLIISRGMVLQINGSMVFAEYGGVLYPEGLMGQNVAYFNHDSIEEIFFEGYSDEMDVAMVKSIEENFNKLGIEKLDVSKMK